VKSRSHATQIERFTLTSKNARVLAEGRAVGRQDRRRRGARVRSLAA